MGFAGVHGAQTPPSGGGSPGSSPVRWDTERLFRPPACYPAGNLEAKGVRALFYEGLPWKGKTTRVFAWYGIPAAARGGRSAEKLPAMVLVHGGGGTAFSEWVRLWTGRGYAALAMDVCGSTPGGSHQGRPRHPRGGPPGWGGFDQVDWPVEDQWAYHAVADIVLANSLLRSFPEIDPERIGVTGISWGGYLTCIVSAVDPRFRFAVPVYGCGFLGEDSVWLETFETMGKAASSRWLTLWDPSRFLRGSKMPMLWVAGTNDFAYPLDSLQKSYRLPAGPRTVCLRVRMPHAHGGPGENPEEIHAFANAILKKKAPLVRVEKQGSDGDLAWATYEGASRVVKADLNFTKDAGPWRTRYWSRVPARVQAEESRVSASLPAAARVYYFNIIDERSLIVSTEHVERPRGPRGEGLRLAPEKLQRLERALEPLHAKYDPSEKMLRQPFHSPGYHTTLKGGYVHPTRESLNYAVALLDAGREEYRKRAIDILERVVALQDKNAGSKTYGIWSWFLEEPLEAMSPPDWNWADFCGMALLQVALDHRRRLPADLMEEVDGAILHAARSIRRRNVGPGYTNIAILGTYVTLVAGETYDNAGLREYGLARWKRFYEYTKHHGAFTEYNSPTYTVVALRELGRMRLHVRDALARNRVEEVYRLAWEEIAHHFHPPTRQWAGPHSRSYRTLLRPSVLGVIQDATDGRVDFGVDVPSAAEIRVPLPCPADLEPFFKTLQGPRDLVKTFFRGPRPLVGTTHLEPAFTIGSINRGDLWNQRRPLVAYWGAAKDPSCLRLRFLHDGYDFADAQFFSQQRGGDVLAGVNLAVDGGDTHVSLDRIRNATVRARDLRLRFELGGAACKRKPEAPRSIRDPAFLQLGGIEVRLAVVYAALGNESPRWEAGREGRTAWLDVVLYEGEERAIDFSRLERAAVGMAVRLAEKGARRRPAEPVPSASLQGGRLLLRWGTLGLSLPVRPARAARLREGVSFGLAEKSPKSPRQGTP